MTIMSAYVVFANAGEAERIGRLVVEEKLAACVNILGPCRSIYRWDGSVETADEVPAIFKTDDSVVGELIARIADLHSYAVPCITAVPAERAFARYADWVSSEVAKRR